MPTGGSVYNKTMPAETSQPRGDTASRLVRFLSSLVPAVRWGLALCTVPGMLLVMLIVLVSTLPAVLLMVFLLLLQLPFFLLARFLLPTWDSPGRENDCTELF